MKNDYNYFFSEHHIPMHNALVRRMAPALNWLYEKWWPKKVYLKCYIENYAFSRWLFTPAYWLYDRVRKSFSRKHKVVMSLTTKWTEAHMAEFHKYVLPKMVWSEEQSAAMTKAYNALMKATEKAKLSMAKAEARNGKRVVRLRRAMRRTAGLPAPLRVAMRMLF